ncbi:hypothetical protein [Archaeoglobus profundus]|uniref:Uncharacterized protein n=1 Tax=Archaeoglobus profundus (strain DSM 5631 / JCM 9629 / NBRC 100127 / Av18) TaxID=572546 RepID=D2RFA0_ARCPA|nr:hypothetical protein [Archaeoglobus profundus]ADB58794.1 hypothetical protein Arcpr_1750 [Archaeoglobus profundus DSM 5631]
MKVCSDVPEGWKPLIEKAMKIEGWETVSAYVRELIKKDLVSKGLLGFQSSFLNSSSSSLHSSKKEVGEEEKAGGEGC